MSRFLHSTFAKRRTVEFVTTAPILPPQYISQPVTHNLLSVSVILSHTASLMHQPACPKLPPQHMSACLTLPPQYISQPVPHYLLSASASLSHTTSSVYQPACPTLPP
ncbi:hypothetical protein BaRGS_00038645 [Batillaria attramentaria]|uniref:Uncharacterized protein n=1 Tax=Batillaria attramentaria TaxID=370345 RepID=A0ABD0J571_9CAEN